MAAIFKDIGEIHSRLFDHRPFLSGEITYFLKEFEEKRGEREVERLFAVLERVTELREGQLLDRLSSLSEAHLPPLSTCLQVASSMAQKIAASARIDTEAILGERRVQREQEWDKFLHDTGEKSVRVDNAFRDKELQLRGYYSQLEDQMQK